MATSSSFLSEDQFQCSICLEVLSEPVSTPCGHNFCKACLTRHWADKELYQCPLCNEKFNKGLKLATNTGFREVVENFKKHHVIADSTSLTEPGQVPCDYCPDFCFRAYKTCLVCLTSFCKSHLEPHQRVAALKRHKLTNPVHNLEDKICKQHNRIVEFFCRNDQTRVCVLCTEHSNHDTVHLEEEYVDRKAQIRKKKADVQENKQKQGKAKMVVQKKKNDKGGAKASSVASQQMLHHHFLFDPCEDRHHVCDHSCISAFTPNHILIVSVNERDFLLFSFHPFENVSRKQRLRRGIQKISEHPYALYYVFFFIMILVSLLMSLFTRLEES
ncbi:E3 ubiquitin/ISG15 ligase TRIM25-like [Melanotaenia boesemani]|uniref:E3 ubiquitin/ISG15 ligase TRIM25-like n=1 Tax=Melanotaenia boesemani TaxID=1250792 RepID=UPI001C0552D8|nr:E3 ubiquitin/ISG15 ligase TRIM25-like [Melanotaenia boesemani]XP_041845158.1 E3 ubiquitin/ISG15 ligase TRIM25-like [Melanotaenia boesemani]